MLCSQFHHKVWSHAHAVFSYENIHNLHAYLMIIMIKQRMNPNQQWRLKNVFCLPTKNSLETINHLNSVHLQTIFPSRYVRNNALHKPTLWNLKRFQIKFIEMHVASLHLQNAASIQYRLLYRKSYNTWLT